MSASSRVREIKDAIEREAIAAGASVSFELRRRGHPRAVIVRGPNRWVIVYPGSPSDPRRSAQAAASFVRRTLRQQEHT
jgi:uncharacterized protein (DUF58 family)